jgi:general secretion pathway protein G
MEKRRTSGFTLARLIPIMGMLVAVLAMAAPDLLDPKGEVIPKFAGRRLPGSERAKETAAMSDIHSLEIALDAFNRDTGGYPVGNNGLQSLVALPGNASAWRGPYVKTIPNDPWGNAYVYAYPARNNKTGVDLLSVGADGKSGTGDDINTWSVKN